MQQSLEIDYIALFVTDVARAVAFYRDVLGFRFPAEHPPERAEGESDGLRIGIFSRAWLPRLLGEERGNLPVSGNAFLLSMKVDDLDAMYKHLHRQNVAIVLPPTMMPWGLRVLFFYDPDGNLLEIAERKI